MGASFAKYERKNGGKKSQLAVVTQFSISDKFFPFGVFCNQTHSREDFNLRYKHLLYIKLFFLLGTFSGFTWAGNLFLAFTSDCQCLLCSLSHVHTWGWAWNNEWAFSPLILRAGWIQLFLLWVFATRPVKQPDKLIPGWRHLLLSDENVSLLSFAFCLCLRFFRTPPWTGDYFFKFWKVRINTLKRLPLGFKSNPSSWLVSLVIVADCWTLSIYRSLRSKKGGKSYLQHFF